MILDTYAWIEYFLESEKGIKVKEIIKEGCYTSIVSLAEIVEWCIKNNHDAEEHIEIVKNLSQIIFLNDEAALLAGKINYEKKKTIKNWGMIDSIIYSTAIINGMKIVTGDPHFRDLENVIMI